MRVEEGLGEGNMFIEWEGLSKEARRIGRREYIC